jgi:hypothetical protein
MEVFLMMSDYPNVLRREGTFQRPRDLGDLSDARVLFGRSYLLTRTVIGVIGVVLPVVFIIGEAFFLQGGLHVRGSISAYYHTPMNDVFVGGLCVIAVMLLTYMAGQSARPDFWLSCLSGVALLVLVFFPTSRSGVPDGAAKCGVTPEPPGCAPIQQLWGETAVATVHFASAAVFILSLAVTCFYFAYLEKVHNNNARMRRLQLTCGTLIFLAVAWVAIGGWLQLDIAELTPLYVGEVVAVWAFAVSWIATARDLWRRLFGSAAADRAA